MFSFKKEKKETSKDRELIDREIGLYEREAKQRVEEEILTARTNTFAKLKEIMEVSADDRRTYEHEFHQAKEDKRVELAGINAAITFKKDLLTSIGYTETTYKKAIEGEAEARNEAKAARLIIETKDKTIESLNELIKVIVGKLPKVELDKLNINVTANGSK